MSKRSNGNGSSMRLRVGRWVAVLGVLALVAAACGGDDDDAAADTGGDTTTTTDTGDDPTDTDGDTGSDDAWAEIVAAAEDEGRVVLYTATVPPVIERLAAGFADAYPNIELEFLRGASGELLSRIEQERDTGASGADMWITTEASWFRDRVAEGALLPPEGPSLEGWPEEFLVDGAIPILSLEPFTVPYNTELVDEPITSYQDLLKPEFEGNIGTTDLVATILTAFYSYLEETEGPGYLEALAAQEPTLLVGASALTQAVASGEIAVSAMGNTTAATPLMAQGAPMDLFIPNPALGIPYASGIFEWGEHPNAAKVLMDWLMSEEAQIIWHGEGESASPISVPGSLDPSTVQPWDPEEWPEERVAEFNAMWEELFK